MKEVEESKFIPHRPDLIGYLTKLREHAISKGEKQAGILVCGPDHLITTV